MIKAAASLRALAEDIKTVSHLTGRHFKKQARGRIVPAISATQSKAANCMAEAQSVRIVDGALLECRPGIKMAETGDVMDFEPAVIAAARRVGLTISETADLLAFLYPLPFLDFQP